MHVYRSNPFHTYIKPSLPIADASHDADDDTEESAIKETKTFNIFGEADANQDTSHGSSKKVCGFNNIAPVAHWVGGTWLENITE